MEERNNENIPEQSDSALEHLIEEMGFQPEDVSNEPIVGPYGVEAVEVEEMSLELIDELKRKRKRRRNTVIVLVTLAVFLFTGAVTGFVFLNRYFTDRITDGSGQSSSQSASSEDSNDIIGPGMENGPTIYLENRPGDTASMMSIPEIYRRVSPSVVMILAGSRSSMALGTGIIMSEDGFIVTNAHIVTDSEDIQIVLSDNETIYDATVMGADSSTDIAVLKIDAKGLQPATFGDSDQVLIGESVVTIGNPYSMNYAQTVTDGIISGVRRNVYDDSMATTLLQTNAQLNPGNSGGPLINRYGQVIGINSAKIMSNGTSTYEGLGFAIPMSDAKSIVDELIRYGFVAPDPVIGITVSYVSPGKAEEDSTVAGCMIMSVEPNSDAWQQGLHIGDIITKINGKTFDDLDGFIAEKNRYMVGDQVELTCWRAGEYFSVRVTLIEAS